MGSIGSSKSKQQAQQESSNWAQNESYGGGFNVGTQDIWGGQSPALGDVYSQARALMSGGSPYAQAGANVGQAGAQAWQQQLTPGTSPYFQSAVQASIDQATQSFRRQVLPELDARSAGVGQLGASRDRLATGEAAGLFGQGVAQSTAQQYGQQYAADQARALQAVGMTPAMQAGQYLPLTTAAGLIGGPTVLGQQLGQQWNASRGAAAGSSSGSSSGGSSGFNMGVLTKK